MKLKLFVTSFALSFLAIAIFASTSYAMSRKGARLDHATRGCMRCHKMETGKHFGQSHTEHLIGIDYISIAELDPALVTADLLDARIKLVDGRVSCITCHVEYAPESHRISERDRNNPDARMFPFLRVDNRASGLCLKCHKK